MLCCSELPFPPIYIFKTPAFWPEVQPEQPVPTHRWTRTPAYGWPTFLCVLISRLSAKEWWTGGVSHYYETDSRCCPTQICMSCLPSALQSLANHSSTDFQIWMLFHLVLPEVTVITFQGSLAGKVKWHDMKIIRLKQVFNSKCQIYKNILWTGTKWDCCSLSYS